MGDDTAACLHAWAYVSVQEVQWHLHVDLLVRIDALEVDVLNLLTERVHLEVTQQNGLCLAIQIQRQDGSVERFFLQCEIKGVVIELDHGCFACTVNDTGDEVRLTQTAARTRSLRFACCCADFDCHFYFSTSIGANRDQWLRVTR